jgi:hypothetical protein
MEQVATSLRIQASHLCDVTWREERTAGHQAEEYHPLAKLNAVRRQREEEEAHVGPITLGILRGSADSELPSRSFGDELHRSFSPLLIGAAAAGAVETLLKATARVDGRVNGEKRQTAGVRRGAACAQDDPYRDAQVSLKLGGEVIPLGLTDENGSLVVDLAEVLASHPELDPRDADADIVVAGSPVGRAELDLVLLKLAARRSGATVPLAQGPAPLRSDVLPPPAAAR